METMEMISKAKGLKMEIIRNLNINFCRCSKCKKIIQVFNWELVNKVYCYDCKYKQYLKGGK